MHSADENLHLRFVFALSQWCHSDIFKSCLGNWLGFTRKRECRDIADSLGRLTMATSRGWIMQMAVCVLERIQSNVSPGAHCRVWHCTGRLKRGARSLKEGEGNVQKPELLQRKREDFFISLLIPCRLQAYWLVPPYPGYTFPPQSMACTSIISTNPEAY